MISLAIQQFRARWQRGLAVFIAIALGVAFFTVALLAGGPLNQNLRSGVGQQFQGADFVVTNSAGGWRGNELQIVVDIDGVEAVDQASFVTGELRFGGISSYLLISNVPSVTPVRENVELLEGVWPNEHSQIALSERTMETSSLEIGDEITIHSWSADTETTFSVVGVYESPSGLARGRADAFVSNEAYKSIADDPNIFALRVQATADANAEQTFSNLESALDDDYSVYSFAEYVDAEVSEFSGNTVALQALLAAFALIALIVSAIVIANSFEINIAQRVRELGLLRSVGASNRQVQRIILSEALVVGLLASTSGVLFGTIVMWIAGRLFWTEGGTSGLELTPLTIGSPILLGLLATLISAYGPARSAMRVHPLQAIRQSDAPVESRSASRRRVIFASLMFALGGSILVLAVLLARGDGASSGLPLLIGIVGGAATFLAVLLSAPLVLPLVSSALGVLTSRVLGVTGELATGNISRNPRRSASASTALLMGVTLMTMMTVGASSVESTIVGEIEDRQPIDLRIRNQSDQSAEFDLSADVVRWESLDGVSSLQATYLAEAELNGQTSSVLAVEPQRAKSILRNNTLNEFDDSAIVIHSDAAQTWSLESGDVITMTGPEGPHDLTVIIGRVGVDEPVISVSTMEHLGLNGEPAGAWIRLEDDADISNVISQVQTGLPSTTNLNISGGAEERESTLEVLDTLLIVVIGLLAAAVVIAIVGIGNTLTLSVVGRTRESGMLRAMGLKRTQVRRMLALEGLTISLAGTVIGLGLGVVYGFVGVYTLFGDALHVEVSIPWAQLGLICLIAIVAGLFASILPARRALSVKPVEALSDIG